MVMDHTGVTRHVFDANDAEALAKAEERFTDSKGHLLAHSTTTCLILGRRAIEVWLTKSSVILPN